MIDLLKVYRGEDYELNSKITIRQPTLDDICTFGEQKYFNLVRLLCATPADQKVEIWETEHIFWDQKDEFELFVSIFMGLAAQEMSILFKDLDVSSFQIVVRPDMKELSLRNQDGVVVDRAIHALLTDYLRQIHRFRKNTDVGFNDATKLVMIEDDKDELEKQIGKPFGSVLLPMISALTNCPEFKYRYDDVWGLPIGVFMDCVERIQRHKSYNYTMHGIYNGCVDLKKVNKKELNWMGELK